MSIARQLAAVGQAATAVIEEEDFKNLRTGKTFKAKIEPIGDIELNTELGRDPRASAWLHVRDHAIDMLPGDKIAGLGGTMQILAANAPDQLADLHLKFCVMQLTDKDS